jgi:ribosome-associated heat shock protein Hsp15
VSGEARIDKWLWAVRLFKTRTLAADACRAGEVLIAGQRTKPAREVHAGEIISAKAHGVQRTVKVLAVPRSRVGAKLVADFLEDLTPPAEYEKARELAPPPQFTWSKGAGRPTKKSRRLWESFGSENPGEP